ncbi:hypothetical protein PMI09_04420 [Rhizobium sp. CF122]|nr:hypothetical protein PMI09_04420 [Rhizobium sp. CF122]
MLISVFSICGLQEASPPRFGFAFQQIDGCTKSSDLRSHMVSG